MVNISFNLFIIYIMIKSFIRIHNIILKIVYNKNKFNVILCSI